MVSLEKVISKINKHQDFEEVLKEISKIKKLISKSSTEELVKTHRLRPFSPSCGFIITINKTRIPGGLLELDAIKINSEKGYKHAGIYRYLFEKTGDLYCLLKKKEGNKFFSTFIDNINYLTKQTTIINPNEIHPQNKSKITPGLIYTIWSEQFQKYQFIDKQFNPLAKQREIKESIEDFLDYMMLEKGGLIGEIGGFISKEKINNPHQFSLTPNFYLPKIKSILYLPQLN